MNRKRFFSLLMPLFAAAWIAAAITACSLLYEPPPGEEAKKTTPSTTTPDTTPAVTPGKTSPKNMTLIRAKDSSFIMGNNTSEQGLPTTPAHTVRFTYTFWMDTTEVTQSDYDTLMKSSYNCQPGAWEEQYGCGARYPVFKRNWYDAALYCNARSKRDKLDTVYRYTGIVGTAGNASQLEGLTIETAKRGYRLPTEAEWEYACRAKTTGDFYWGNGAIDKYAWYVNNSAGRTHPVAGKSPNGFGLYDMSGNVAEWCNDWYSVYPAGTQTDPYGPGPSGYDNKRVVRGGSWSEETMTTYSVSRNKISPSAQSTSIGFRAVLPADSTM